MELQIQRQQSTSTSEDHSRPEKEISDLKAEVSRLRRQNESLREKEHRLHEAEIKADMYQKQVEELKNLPPRLFSTRQASPEKKKVRISDHATTSTPVFKELQRNDALNDRLRELQKENIDLRSRLAGVTPKNAATAANIENCRGCRDLNRQKTHQATYLEEKVIAARQRAVQYEQHCKQLRVEMNDLNKMLSDIHSKYQKQIDQLSEHASMYKSRSERLERWNCSSLRGFQTDIKQIREKLSAVEREIVQTQLLYTAGE
uniref:Centrosomal protein of 162 kDa n=1 Tax=Plectus sambesii TaxID=2011161 RepID=A0A914XI07_9BILA